MISILILILVILAIFGSAPWYPYSTGWGYGPSGGLLVVLCILLLLLYA